MENGLQRAVFTTIRYFDVLDVPVTATQIWQCLLVETETRSRWGGHRHWSLPQVQQAAAALVEKIQIETKWGYFTLPGRITLVEKRLKRHRLSQAKWKIARFAARFLAAVPFVRGLAGSGSLAIDNTHDKSDLDFLIITAPRRIWTARLLLLAMSQLLGRRRKHWDTQAPDKVCLNHYVSAAHLHLPAELHNTYTAVQYTQLVPVFGGSAIKAFQQANASWIFHHVMTPIVPTIQHVYTVRLSASVAWVKKLIENILFEPVGDVLESWAERLQRRLIVRHQAGRAGRVALSSAELAFHPDTKVPALLAQYHQDPSQQELF